jgi:hypothetical protein
MLHSPRDIVETSRDARTALSATQRPVATARTWREGAAALRHLTRRSFLGFLIASAVSLDAFPVAALPAPASRNALDFSVDVETGTPSRSSEIQDQQPNQLQGDLGRYQTDIFCALPTRASAAPARLATRAPLGHWRHTTTRRLRFVAPLRGPPSPPLEA